MVAAVARSGTRADSRGQAAGRGPRAVQPARPRAAHRHPDTGDRRGQRFPAPRSAVRRHDPRFAGGELDANLRQAQALRTMAADRGVTAGQLALAWLLAQGEDVVPIPGTRNPARLAENVAAADISLSPADLRSLGATTWSGDRQSFAAPATARRV
ncbi:aldo/keto reductase [Amycolatopsis sp.]|uniref:aldo/keto reductase n=1 Tax=Amycolatopsis sp. TaxID=37632 RepID=UPI002B8613FC|nr:aldo/keto reductase [Amycolatopsis sp.]HVV12194.1 aldo/keto reductase [Amycolatopsis sp.]